MDDKGKTRESSSRARETNVANMGTERQISGETKIKETKTRIEGNPVSRENVTAV